jgi:hypothetical protein
MAMMTSQPFPPTPGSHPLIVIDFKKLYGAYPSTSEEADDLKNQVCRDVFGSDAFINESVSHNYVLVAAVSWSSFIQRTCELFDMEIATHAESSGIDQNTAINKMKTVIFSYPEYINTHEDLSPSITNTAQIWKEITNGHPIPVVERILILLSKCSRDLLWKYNMSNAIRKLAYDEEQRKELQLWKTEHRPANLEKLYEVRETFDLRVAFMQNKYSEIVQDREIRVQRELELRQEQSNPWSGSSKFDWDNDASEEDDNAIISYQNINDTEEGESIFSPHPSKFVQEEDTVRNLCTTEEEKMCLTLLSNLEKRLDDIDQLLESLEEEQWIDDEVDDDEGSDVEKEENIQKLSILDQILAMILGSSHRSDAISLHDHYSYIRNEHEAMSQGWKDHFGRFPPSSTFHIISNNVEEGDAIENLASEIMPDRQIEVRSKLGIFDNELDDWEDVADWDVFIVPKTSENPSDTVNEVSDIRNEGKRNGLRPGGSVFPY